MLLLAFSVFVGVTMQSAGIRRWKTGRPFKIASFLLSAFGSALIGAAIYLTADQG